MIHNGALWETVIYCDCLFLAMIHNGKGKLVFMSDTDHDRMQWGWAMPAFFGP